jgi:hypothetical protein
MSLANLSCRRLSWILGLACVLGCSSSDSTEQTPWGIDSSSLVPVKGVITLNGKPLAKAIVAFMSKTGIPGVAETGEDGRYTLETTNLPGAIPGDYKVSISYLVSPEGQSQGLGARSAMVQSPAMRAAVEQLPTEYSDLNRSKLSAHVGSQGGTFDFDVVASVEPARDKATDKDAVETRAADKDAVETKAADKK